MRSTQGAGLRRTDEGWVARDQATVLAALDTPDLDVVEAPAATQAGTIAWLRASVSRFTNGADHERRRAQVIAVLGRTDAAALRADAFRRARADSRPVADLARRVPVATLAAALGAAEPNAVAEAVLDCAAGYFPTDDAAVVARADQATARLVELLAHPDLEIVVARVAALVQACDATAGLIMAALTLLPSPLASDALVHEAALRRPPLRVMRRVAAADTLVAGQPIARGETVTCDIEQASRSATDVLTFGAGPRSCPGISQALALATGVVDAVRPTGG